MKHCVIIGLAVVFSSLSTSVQAANTFSLGATNLVFGPELSTNCVALTASPAGAAWTATTAAAWLSLGAAGGTGSTNLAFVLAANPGATRTGAVAVAGQTLTVVQAGADYTAAGMMALSSPAAFSNARDVAAATNGDVCFVDDLSGTVCRWSRASNSIGTVCSGFNSPSGLCIDSSNNIYVADTFNNMVKRWDAGSGAVSTAISYVARPSDVAVNAAGNLYILDTHNHALWEQPAGGSSLTLLLDASSLMVPNTMALDSLGNLYIADSTYSSLRSYNLATAAMTTRATLASAPLGVAVDTCGNACVSLPGSGAVYRYNAANGVLSKLIDGLQSPAGMAFDAAGNLFIGNTNASGLLQILPRAFVNTNTLTPGPGAADLSLPAVVSANTSFSGPFAPSSDQTWLSITGITNGVVSFHLAKNTSAGVAPREAHIGFLGRTIVVRQAAAPAATPQGLAIAGQAEGPGAGLHSVTLAAPAGSNWVAAANDSWLHVTTLSGTGGTNVVYSFDANPGATRSGTLTIAGNTFTVTQAGASCVASSMLATMVSNGLAGPNGVAVDLSGNVYFSDTTNNAVKKWNPATGTVTTLIASGLNFPVGVAVDVWGNVYIADGNNGAIKLLAAGASSPTTLVSGLTRPRGVAVDSIGNVYFSDQYTGKVYKWSYTNGLVSTLISSGLSTPSGIAVDLCGNVYVANTTGATIVKWNSASGLLTTVVSSGIGSPYALAVDGTGDLYITDSTAKSVRRYCVTNSTLSTVATTGLNLPHGLAVDSSGNLYVSDFNNNTVVELPRAFVNTNTVYEYADAGTDQLSGLVVPASQNLSAPFFPGTSQTWLSVERASSSGIGIRFTLNTNSASRTATLSVLGQAIPVVQGTTNYVLSATNLVFGPEASTNTVALTVHPSIATWSASSAADWLHLSTTTGMGSGVLEFALDANVGSTRTGTVTVAGLTLTVVQGPAAYTLGATNLVFGPEASTNSVTLTISPVIASWNASSATSWIHLVNTSGTGNTNLAFILDANTNATRTGTVAVSGQSLTVVQAGVHFISAGAVTLNSAKGYASVLDVAVNSNGDACFVDAATGAVYRWSHTDESISMLCTNLNSPSGLCIDRSNNIYIADTFNNAVKRWDAGSGAVSTAITYVASPSDVAVDATSNLYVLDTHNHALWEQPAGGSSLSILLNAGSLMVPNTMALDSLGNLYIADSTYSSLRSYNLATTAMTTWATLASAPQGVALDAGGNACVSLPGSGAVYRYNTVNGALSKLIEGLQNPAGMAFDAAGNLFIACANSTAPLVMLPRAFVDATSVVMAVDGGNASLPAVLPDTTSLSGSFAPSSDQTWLTITGITNGAVSFSASTSTNTSPRQAHITLLGRSIAINQMPAVSAGLGLAMSGRSEGPAAGADSVVLALPAGSNWVATANDSWLHVSTSSGTGSTNVVYSFDANTNDTRRGTLTIAGNTFSVAQAGVAYLPATGAATMVSNGLNGPCGLALDAGGNVYIADTTNKAIRMWNIASNTLTTVASSGLNLPCGIALDAWTNLYVADSSDGAIKRWFAGDSGFSTLVSGLNRPVGVATDGAGNVYFTDAGTGTVQMWSSASGTISTVIASGLSSPSGLAADWSGNLYIADAGNCALKKWNAATSNLTTLVSGFISMGGVAADASGDVYAADPVAGTVSKYSAASNSVCTLALPGVKQPYALALNSAGCLFLSELASNSILQSPRVFLDVTPVMKEADPDIYPYTIYNRVLPASQYFAPAFFPTASASWLSVLYFNGNNVGISLDANTAAASRTAILSLLGRQILIIQDPAEVAVGTTNLLVGPGAGANSVCLSVRPRGSAWTASASVSWLHLTATAGAGATNVIFTIDANPGATRTGTLTLAGLTVTVTQAGASYAAVVGTQTIFDYEVYDWLGSVAVNSAGTIYFAEYSPGFLDLWDSTTHSYKHLTDGVFFYPAGLALDASNNVYIADSGNNVIKRWNAADSSVTTVIGSGLLNPHDVALDQRNNLYIADAYHCEIKRFSFRDGSMASLATYDAQGFFIPWGLAVDVEGNVYYIAGYNSDQINKWTRATGATSTILTGLTGARYVTVDGSGNVYVAADGFGGVVKLDAATGTLTRIITVGTTLFGSAIDLDGNFYLTQGGTGALYELPHAFVDVTPKTVSSAAGSDTLPPILPPSPKFSTLFTPTSDQDWLTITGFTNGVISYSFATNGTGITRTAHIAVMDKTVAVTQFPLTADKAPLLTPPTLLSNNTVLRFTFTNTTAGATYSVLASTNVAAPLTNWSVLLLSTNTPDGVLEILDTNRTDAQRFYRVRSP